MRKRNKAQPEKKPLSFVTWLVILIACIFLVSILLFAFSYISFRSHQEKTIVDTLKKNNKQVADYTNTLLVDIENILVLPIFAQKEASAFFEAVTEYEKTGIKPDVYKNYLWSAIHMIYNYKTTIHSVAFYAQDGSYDYLLRGQENIQLFSPQGQTWYQKCREDRNGSPVLIPTYKLYNSEYGVDTNTYVFGVGRSVIDTKNSKVAGVLQICINETVLYNFIKSALTLQGQGMMIIDENGYVISGTDREHIGKKLEDPFLVSRLGIQKDPQKLISVSDISWTGWKVISIVPAASVSRQISQTIGTVMVVMLALIILSALIIFSVSMKIITPMKKLTGQMTKVARGNFDVRIHEDGLKETAFLSDVFNYMTQELEELVQREYIDKITQKELEIKMLQYQINPHFIYNSIESIKMMSLLNNDEEAAQMLTSLGKIMRYSLSGVEEVVSVRDEVAMLEEYVALQAIRFDDIYNIIIDVDISLYQCKVPKLILQPFVENAIEHGMDNLESGGEIYINGFWEGSDHIVFTIVNNGVQLTQDTIDMLNNDINSSKDFGKHIGMKNVNKRLKLTFGGDCGVVIGKDSEGRTMVTIRIPAIKKAGLLIGKGNVRL